MRTRGMRLRRKPVALVADSKGTERRRGHISFLTWAFVLAEVFGRDGVASSLAHAAEPDDPTPAHANDAVAPSASDISDRPMTGIGDDDEPATTVSPGYAHTIPAGGANFPSVDLLARVDEGPTSFRDTVASSGGSTAGGNSHANVSADPHPSTESAADYAGHAAEPNALLQIGVEPDGLVHGLVETLGDLPLVGGLLGNTVQGVASSVDGLVGGLVGGLLSPAHAGGADSALLASTGSMAFDTHGDIAHAAHETHTASGFTDYGIALELGSSAGGLLSLGASSPSDAPQFMHDHDSTLILHTPDYASPDEPGQRPSVDILA